MISFLKALNINIVAITEMIWATRSRNIFSDICTFLKGKTWEQLKCEVTKLKETTAVLGRLGSFCASMQFDQTSLGTIRIVRVPQFLQTAGKTLQGGCFVAGFLSLYVRRFIYGVCFAHIRSSFLLFLVARKGYASQLWYFLGILFVNEKFVLTGHV